MRMNELFRFCGLDLPTNVFLAPMAGITARPFREIAFSLGTGLAWTEMISAEGLVRGDRKTLTYLPAGDEGGPVAVQLFGRRPEVLRDAALIAEETSASVIDINMGCPVRKIVKGGSGAALLRDPAAVRRILEAVCSAVNKPVTIKIRSGWDDNSLNAVEIARIARDSGAAAVVVHGRTARQGFSGKADWGIIAEVAGSAGLPVVGNGDLRTAEDVERSIRLSGCDAVMIGRAALGRPWIFRDVQLSRSGEKPPEVGRAEVGRLMLRHLELNLREFGERRGLVLMRRPLSWYCRGFPGSGEFRRRVNHLEEPAALRREIELFAGSVSE